MARTIMMRHPALGIQKKGFYGFSWTTLFFGGIPALFRGDAVTGMVVIVLNLVTASLAGVVWAFFYIEHSTG